MTMTHSLLEFILNLLRNDEAKAAFNADPARALADAGLSDVCSEDVADAMSYVAEYHPVSFVGEREYNVGNSAISQHASTHYNDDHHNDDHHEDRPHEDRPHEDHGWHGDPHAGVVERLEYITNNYAYTDSHDTVIDRSVNQSIWNEGRLEQRFDDHSVTATDHSVAAGRDIDGNVANGDGNVVGDGNSVGNSFDDHSIRGSFNGNNIAGEGGVAGNNNDGNVTNPLHTGDIATTGGKIDESKHNSDNRTDDHHIDYKADYKDDHHVDYKDDHHSDFDYKEHNHYEDNRHYEDDHHIKDSAVTHTEQHGVANINVSPALNDLVDLG